MEAYNCPIETQFSGEISTLLSPRPLPQVQAYFEALVAERKCSGLRVKPDGDRGKGVYSAAEFQEGDLLLIDRMLVGAQHSSNKIDCLVCSFCFQFIGSIELQIGRKLYLEELGVSSMDECGISNGMGCSSSSAGTRLPHNTIQSLMDGTLHLPYSENFPLPSVVPCLGGCKEAYYCSKSCAEADWDSFHSLLCVGLGSRAPNREALLKFMKHANETNDIFIPAAKVISFTILRYRKLTAAHVAEQQNHGTSNPCNSSMFPVLVEAWKPVSMGFKRRWWDCIALPEDVDSSDEADFRMQIKDLAFESLQLLKEAVYIEECAPSSPVEDYFLYIDDLPPSKQKEAVKITKSILDALGDDYYVPCEGTAFFPLQSCMNHSCIPNAKAFKREEDRDGQATVIALRSISKEEEITISYIDEDLPYEERQQLLADYGFTCNCPRCIQEAP